MQIGIHAFGEKAATAEGVGRAQAVGAEGICFGVSSVPGAAEGVPPLEGLREAVHRYQDAGIAVPAGYGGRFSNAMMLSDASREAEYRRLITTLERMAAVGIRAVLFYTTPERPQEPVEEARAVEQFIAFCQRLGADAQAIGIGIACHPWVSRPELLHGYQRLAEVCQHVPQEAMGITYCPGGALAGDDMLAFREQFRGRIFSRFAQADSALTRQKGGTGLGLAICKRMIEAMNGRIGFDDREGGGTVFFIDIPLKSGVEATS